MLRATPLYDEPYTTTTVRRPLLHELYAMTGRALRRHRTQENSCFVELPGLTRESTATGPLDRRGV